jgi:DNA-3-methyladenine glycosylase
MSRRSLISRDVASSPRVLTRADLPSETVALARFLVGKVIVRTGLEERLSGRIVETEAYPLGDDACHARSGRTARNASLFLPHGHIYVYRAYGISMMLNVSSEPEHAGAGVLIRALEPIDGLEAMHRRRGIDDVYRLTRGPGCLAQAMQIDLTLDGLAYGPGSPLSILDDGYDTPRLGQSTRIGITRNADAALRYFIPGNRWVSGPARLNRSGG